MKPNTAPVVTSPAGVAAHPLGAFFALSFILSWAAFIPAAILDADILIVVGAFGPAAAAGLVTHATGESARQWLRTMWRWRIPARYYAFALGVPPLIVAMTQVELVAVGQAVDMDPPSQLLPTYVTTLVLVALLGGGQEEPGWRGFALGRLEERHSPLVATAVLGLSWGAWHLPIYGLYGFAGPLLFVGFYTWLYDHTRSVAACVLLHSSFNTSVGLLELSEQGTSVFVALLLATAAALLVVTAEQWHRRGRLPGNRSGHTGGRPWHVQP